MSDLPTFANGILLLFARVGAILMLLPGFSEDAIPARLRFLMAFATTIGLSGLLSPHVTPLGLTPALLLTELGIGIGLGLLVRIIFHAATMAGSIISLQIGLSSALISDPSLGGHSALLSRLLALAGVTAALAAGIHHLWFGAIVKSYTAFPPGALPDIADLAQRAVQATSDATKLAVGLSAPFLIFGLVFNLTLGLAARLAPAIQIFFIAQPLTILAGLALLLLVFGPIVSAYASALADWTQAMLG
jgi:flagellar biosynthetic protein FliR